MQESTLLRLAERQAGREEELQAAKQKVAELEAELGDLQREVELRQEQEQALKEVGRLLTCLSSQVWKGTYFSRQTCKSQAVMYDPCSQSRSNDRAF